MLDEAKFNLEIRRVLKTFGVSAQREIETAVRSAIDSGDLMGAEALSARITLEVEPTGLRYEIADTIALS